MSTQYETEEDAGDILKTLGIFSSRESSVEDQVEQLKLQQRINKELISEVLYSGEALGILNNEDTPSIRRNLLIELSKSALGESRGGSRRKPSDEAWEWIISEERNLPFAFHQCCLSCGVDPEKMLDWLLYYKRKLSK